MGCYMRRAFLKLSWRDSVSALVIFGLGLFAVMEALSYRLGELRNIGPGTFPLIVGTLLILSGLLIIAEGSGRPNSHEVNPEGGATLRVLAFVSAALFAFALLMPRFGAVPAIMICVFLAAQADGSLRPLQILVLAAGMAAFCALLFATVLNLPLDLFKW